MQNHHDARQTDHPYNVARIVDQQETQGQHGLDEVGDDHQHLSVEPVGHEPYERLQERKPGHSDGEEKTQQEFTAREFQNEEKQGNGVEPLAQHGNDGCNPKLPEILVVSNQFKIRS